VRVQRHVQFEQFGEMKPSGLNRDLVGATKSCQIFMNPYAPAAPVVEPAPEPEEPKPAFRLTWTLLIDLTITSVYLAGLHRVSIHYQAFYFTGDSSAFFSELANDFTVLGAVIVLALVMFSDRPQNYSKNIRLLTLVICIALAFHFPSRQFTSDTLLRGLVFTLAVLPMILFGHSIPQALSRAWVRLKSITLFAKNIENQK